MAKATGPLFSLAAHGTYRRELVFRTRGQITTVSKPQSYKAPRSVPQLNAQQKVRYMQAEWRTTPDATKTAWKTRAVTLQMSGYNLYWREWIRQFCTPGNPPTIPA